MFTPIRRTARAKANRPSRLTVSGSAEAELAAQATRDSRFCTSGKPWRPSGYEPGTVLERLSSTVGLRPKAPSTPWHRKRGTYCPRTERHQISAAGVPKGSADNHCESKEALL